jgi:hypothetical protein
MAISEEELGHSAAQCVRMIELNGQLRTSMLVLGDLLGVSMSNKLLRSPDKHLALLFLWHNFSEES